MAEPTKRKGAPRINDIPPDVLVLLNAGKIETANLVEWLALDREQLLKTVLPKLGLRAAVKPALDRIADAADGSVRIAMQWELRGDRAECDRYLDMAEHNTRFRSPTLQFRLRVAAWYGDMQQVQDIRESLAGEDADGFGLYVVNFARAVAGELEKQALDELAASLLARAPSPRFYTLMCQNCVEIYCARGFPEDALRYYQQAADRVLIDIEWTDRCPLLKAMRLLPGFAEARRKVRQRVQAMWSL